jgi:hypothetical protein
MIFPYIDPKDDLKLDLGSKPALFGAYVLLLLSIWFLYATIQQINFHKEVINCIIDIAYRNDCYWVLHQ